MERTKPLPKSAATSYIISFFNKKKQIDTFVRPQYTVAESSVENELRLTSSGLARVFTYEELKMATDNFKEELGRGGYGRVYIGKLSDERMVAVKELIERDQKQREQFINEVNVLSCLDHENLVALYGFTYTDKELLLVYELVPNGTLSDHLHGHLTPLTLAARIHIAIGTAEALSHLHSRDPQIIHRDVKPENILLDYAFRVKVADFGLCRLLPRDKQLSTLTQSTIGYQDPEYERIFTLTDKSDVYSFGVVLMELISGKKAVDVKRNQEEIYLDRMALNKIRKNKLGDLVDPELGYHDNHDEKRIIKSVAKLASQCLEPKRKNRPLMREVLEALKGIGKEMEHIDVDEGGVVANNEPLPLVFGIAPAFTYKELKKATNSFNPSLQLTDSELFNTYFGKLQDGRMVAVKVLYDHDDNLRLLEQFYNEVTVLSCIHHQNLVTLYGCTDPTKENLLLVYEFVPNGTLHDHLHGQRPTLQWSPRMQIAIQTAEGLTYLHNHEPSIIHRDVKTSSILLDATFNVKITDLGICGFLPGDTTHISTLPRGTMGYRDPESYFRLSDKADVYSFGVVLLELISGKQAVDANRDISDIYLKVMALRMIVNKELEQLVDQRLGYESNSETKRMVDLVAELACRCLQSEGNLRPAMADVVTDLQRIRDGTPQIQC